MSDSKYLPTYHFTAPEQRHYPFDPNGFIYHNGRYHAFYLFQDDTIFNGKCCWGHVSTTDFIHWNYHPVALGCEHEDDQAMFSGCALKDKNGMPVLVYFSVGQGICIATPMDNDLIEWRKSPANPVIPLCTRHDPEYYVYNVFDPHAWLDEDGHYYVILGGMDRPDFKYDSAFLFRSDDLVDWEYLRPFYHGTERFTKPFDDCACPDFFKIGDKYALLCISHTRGARYFLGDYVKHTFIPQSHHMLNGGGGVFAPETWLDDKGRRIACFWNVTKTMDYPWTIMECWALPRELRLAPDGSCLLQFVPDEFKTLYGKAEELHIEKNANGHSLLPIHSRCCKLELTMTINSGKCVFQLLSDANGDKCLELILDKDNGTIVMDASKSDVPFNKSPYIFNMNKAEEHEVSPGQIMPFSPADGNRYELDIYLDNSIVDVFSRDGRFACSQAVLNGPTCDSIAIQTAQAKGAVFERLVFIPLSR